ncbi:MAG: hypothetical protein A3K19_10915 [Lentisphaerae bacterium RIFOXYB12_FULL_65_16]|nr:MAG: hypothetical protein A3K18_18120 [Lentisphaerae bacterium RIFOXYA12_64_32]OGV87853.1 MAG: hypothetical protein A3K19_10915 [Lentisphaerae bacterium RIFOXYB12_FULL_65_16]
MERTQTRRFTPAEPQAGRADGASAVRNPHARLPTAAARSVSHATGQRAFTLIELLVVISIIAVLASLLMPALSQAKDKARDALCVSQEKQLMLTVLLYTSDNDEYYIPGRTNNTAFGANYCTWLPYLLSQYGYGSGSDYYQSYNTARKAINAGATFARCPQRRLPDSTYDANLPPAGGVFVPLATDPNHWTLPTWYNYGMNYVRFSPNNGLESIRSTVVKTPAKTIFAGDSTIDPLNGTWSGYFHYINKGWNGAYPDARHPGFRSNVMAADGHVEALYKATLFTDNTRW